MISTKLNTNKLFFLSMAPQFFGTIAKHLKSENIVDGKGFERLIVENHLVQIRNCKASWMTSS